MRGKKKISWKKRKIQRRAKKIPTLDLPYCHRRNSFAPSSSIRIVVSHRHYFIFVKEIFVIDVPYFIIINHLHCIADLALILNSHLDSNLILSEQCQWDIRLNLNNQPFVKPTSILHASPIVLVARANHPHGRSIPPTISHWFPRASLARHWLISIWWQYIRVHQLTSRYSFSNKLEFISLLQSFGENQYGGNILALKWFLLLTSCVINY